MTDSPSSSVPDRVEGTASSQSAELPESPLPPVQPPSAGFLLQLFVIPMVIVTIIVMVWLMLNWLAHMGRNPQQLVRDLGRLNDASWQQALTLADLLRNPDYDYLKRDPEMANRLIELLTEQLDREESNENAVRLRMFLCRALGEFRVPEVLPPLIRAAEQEEAFPDVDVRRAALEALAVYAASSPESLSENDQLMRVLIDASRERSDNPQENESRAELRSTAAFVLGVVGGEEARDRLALMLADAYANTRYNACLGLTRHGDIRSRPVLLEMLDPRNEQSASNEQHETGKASKRLMVITNGMRGATELAAHNDVDDLSDVRGALEEIVDSDLELFSSRARRGIRVGAEKALIAYKQRQQESPK